MEINNIINIFGFDPETIGLRHRSWWILSELSELDEEDINAGAKIGYLIVKARDGSSNPIDVNALKLSNFHNTICDDIDSTYRYYYFKPLPEVGDEQ